MSNGIQVFLALMVTVGMTLSIYAAYHVLAQSRRRSPDTLARMQQLFDTQQNRIAAQGERMDAMELEIDDLRSALADQHEETRQLRDGINRLVSQIRGAGMEPVWTPERVTKKERFSRATLARSIDERFSVDEINELAYEFGIHADELTGETRAARARALVTWASDHNRLGELQRRVAILRSDMNRPHL